MGSRGLGLSEATESVPDTVPIGVRAPNVLVVDDHTVSANAALWPGVKTSVQLLTKQPMFPSRPSPAIVSPPIPRVPGRMLDDRMDERVNAYYTLRG